MKIKKLKAVYSINISKSLYEEIRIDEKWDEDGRASHWDWLEEGFIWSELFAQSNEDPFDKWAWNFPMFSKNGSGTPESFFENHFAKKEIRRRVLFGLYPDPDSLLSQEEYYKSDPRISWLYYKRSFDAVFPVLCEFGKTQLVMELEGCLDNGKRLKFSYKTIDGGKLEIEGKKTADIGFNDEKYRGQDKATEPDIIRNGNKGRKALTIYGMHSLEDLLKALEMAAGSPGVSS